MAITIIVAIVAVAVALLIAVPLTCKVAVNNKAKKDAEVVGTAEDRARSIIDEALKTAETKKREALLEVKEESLRTKNELEKETKERRSELQKYERRVLSKEESVDKKADAVEKREAECTAKVAELQKREKKVDELEQKGVQELERISGLTSDQAKDEFLSSVEDDVKVDVARMYKELENRAKEEAGKKAKEYVVNAIQKCAVDHVAETTISVVQLPSDQINTCQCFKSTNVTSFTSDDSTLHLITWKLYNRNCSLCDMVYCTFLDCIYHVFLCLLTGVFFRAALKLFVESCHVYFDIVF